MNLTDLVQEIKNELAAGPAIADISCRDIVVKLGSRTASAPRYGHGVRSIFKADSPRLSQPGLASVSQLRLTAEYSAPPSVSLTRRRI